MTINHGHSERFFELDACRGVASICVVLAHLFLHYELIFGFAAKFPALTDWDGAIFLLSRLPVYFFFLISGYVIGLTLLNVKSIREFAVFRFARLFPAYWAAIMLTSGLLILFPHVGKTPSASDIATNLTMAQGLLGARNIDPVYWSLTYELVFYGLIATCFSFVKPTPRNLAAFATAWLGASALAYSIVPDTVRESPLLEHLFQYTPFFTGGIAFYLWRQKMRSTLVTMLLIASAMIAVTRIEVFGAVALVLFAAFFVVISGRASALNCVPLLYLGRISYPLYLFHLVPGFLVINALDSRGAPLLLSASVALVAIIVGAHLIHVLIEVPARRKIRSAGSTSPQIRRQVAAT